MGTPEIKLSFFFFFFFFFFISTKVGKLSFLIKTPSFFFFIRMVYSTVQETTQLYSIVKFGLFRQVQRSAGVQPGLGLFRLGCI